MPGFTVHELVETQLYSRRTEEQILTDAFRTIECAVGGLIVGFAFVDVEHPGPLEHALQSVKRNAFVYSAIPPFIPGAASQTYKLWGSLVSEGEIYCLADLEDFRHSTAQRGVLDPDPAYNGPSTRLQILPKRPRDNDGQSLYKRRKMDSDSAYKIIPQPHSHPSPFLLSNPHPKGRPFNKTTPVFLPPYTDFSLDDDDRVAWLIPVHGSFPWAQSSSGHITDRVTQNQAAIGEVLRINWTRLSLLAFWDFLLVLRQNAAFGSMGIAFHPFRTARTDTNTTDSNAPKVAEDRCPTAGPLPHPRATPSEGIASRSTGSRFERGTLSNVEFIKIYHDAAYTFHVRSALDVWAYHPPNTAETGGATEASTKFRLLKGAALPLVDDISRGVLIS